MNKNSPHRKRHTIRHLLPPTVRRNTRTLPNVPPLLDDTTLSTETPNPISLERSRTSGANFLKVKNNLIHIRRINNSSSIYCLYPRSLRSRIDASCAHFHVETGEVPLVEAIITCPFNVWWTLAKDFFYESGLNFNPQWQDSSSFRVEAKSQDDYKVLPIATSKSFARFTKWFPLVGTIQAYYCSKGRGRLGLLRFVVYIVLIYA